MGSFGNRSTQRRTMRPKGLISKISRPVPKPPERKPSRFQKVGGWATSQATSTLPHDGGGRITVTPDQADELAGQPLSEAQKEGLRVRVELAERGLTPW